MLNHVTIHLFQLQQCGEQQVKRKHHIVLHFVPDSLLLPDTMRRAHKEPDFHSLVDAELTPKQGERICSGKLRQIQSGRSRLWLDKLGEGTRPCFSPFPGCSLLRSAVA